MGASGGAHHSGRCWLERDAQRTTRRCGERTAAGLVRDQGRAWSTVTYFTVWTVRLLGLWPEARVSDETVEIVHEMFERPITALAPRAWSKNTAGDLRRVLIRTMEQHAERRFLTVSLLEAL